MRALIALLLTAATAFAQEGKAEDRPGAFDYYVLALSWSPTWCALDGDARGAEQCTDAADTGWVLHGLWPQHDRGWPEHCQTAERAPSRAMTRDMADIMGSSGLAWHQWKKHGSCTGLSARDYYALSRDAFASITRPDVFRKLSQPVRVPARVVEQAFLKANPRLGPDGITITCRAGRIQEARICLSKALVPIACGVDTRRDCTLSDALFDPIR